MLQLAVLLVASLTGLAGSSAAVPVRRGGDTIRITDDWGRTFTFPHPPGRIVSLIPTTTEILFALGAGDRLVGRTQYDVHPPEAREVPSVGEGVFPFVELVVVRPPAIGSHKPSAITSERLRSRRDARPPQVRSN